MREDHRATTRTALLSTCLTKGLMQGWGVATFNQNRVPSSLTIHSHSVLTPHPNLWPMRLKSRHCFLDEMLDRPSPLTLAGLEQPLVNCEAGPGLFPAPSYARDGLLQRSPTSQDSLCPALSLESPGPIPGQKKRGLTGHRWPPSQAGGYSSFHGRKGAWGLVLAEGFFTSYSVPI